MLEFPKSTFFNKKIPKSKFYEKLGASNSLEQLFVREIEAIFWQNKLSPETINISAGSTVKEIQIIEIVLKAQSISKAIIEAIDKNIPYYLVFVLRYKEQAQIQMSYKETILNREGRYKIDSFYQTEWMPYESLTLNIEGLDLDVVYENFLLQVSEEILESATLNTQTSLKEAIENTKAIEKINAKIKMLENKIKNEKQFNMQVKLLGQLRQAQELLNSMQV